MSNSSPWTGQLRVPTSDGLELAVRTAGDPSAPTALLVHGFPDTADVWDYVAAELAKTMRVVAYDVRGAGESGTPRSRSGYRLDQLARDLRAVIAATSPDAQLHLVGHDWGSIQSWEAVTDPGAGGLFASFTSISGPCLDHVGFAARRLVRERPTAAVLQAGRSWYIGMLQIPKLPELFLSRGFARRIARQSTGSSSDSVHGVELYRANIVRVLRHPRERRTTVPVQVLVAAKDRFVGPDLFDDLDQWVASLTVSTIEGGHWLPRTHASEVAAAVRAFAADARV